MGNLNGLVPHWHENITEFGIGDRIQGGPDGIDNLPHRQLAERTLFLREQLLATAASLSDHNDRITAIEGDSAAVAGRAQRVAWNLGDGGFDFDLFAPGYAWRDLEPIGGVITVQGDDSIDAATTAGLQVGATYVVWKGADRLFVTVAQVLSAHRFRATAPVPVSLTDAQIGRSDWRISDGFADAPVGGALFSRVLTAVRHFTDGRVVVRRDAGDAIIDIAWRPAGSSAWTLAQRVETRQQASGTRDEVWAIGGGPLEVRAIVSAGLSGDGARVHHLVAYTAPRAGVADLVQRPVSLAPVGGEVGASETPTLTASVYRSLYEVPQAAARWQISREAAFGTVLHDQATGAVTSYQVPVGVLQVNTTYFWRVAYIDENGVMSPWAEPGSFATGTVFEYVATPAVVAPAAGATGVSPTPTLQSGAFGVVGGADTHAASQWRIARDAAMTAVVHDSGNVEQLVAYPVPPGAGLQVLTTYWWQVRHVGARIGPGGWSLPSSFVVQAVPAAPENIAPANGAATTPVAPTLKTTAFFVPGGQDAHSRTQYQVAVDAAFNQIVYDSGDSSDLTAHTVPAAKLAGATAYHWRARHKGLNTGYGPFSAPTSFTTEAPAGSVMLLASQPWPVPAGVTEARVMLVEPGVDGGPASNCCNGPGSGGGRGGRVKVATVALTPGQTHDVTIGLANGAVTSLGTLLSTTTGVSAAGGTGGPGNSPDNPGGTPGSTLPNVIDGVDITTFFKRKAFRPGSGGIGVSHGPYGNWCGGGGGGGGGIVADNSGVRGQGLDNPAQGGEGYGGGGSGQSCNGYTTPRRQGAPGFAYFEWGNS